MKKDVTYYQIPNEYWHRIHFVRPRFKANIENVLLYMANECCRIPTCSCEDYSKRYFQAIKMYPGNIGMTDKTLQNWRTEIPALFVFYTEDQNLDNQNKVSSPENQILFIRNDINTLWQKIEQANTNGDTNSDEFLKDIQNLLNQTE